MKHPEILILCVLALATGCRSSAEEEAFREDNLFNRLAEEYFSDRARFYPVEATLKGYHQYDGELGDFTQGAIEDRLAWVRDFRQRLLGVDITKVSRTAYFDLSLLTSAVKAETQLLGVRREWKLSPLYYSDKIHNGLLSLLRTEHPSDTQIQSLLSRLEQIPSLIEAAQENIENPPRLLVEEGISELRRGMKFIQDLLTTLEETSSPRKQSELKRKTQEAVRSLNQFITYLESRVLPKATLSFALGSDEISRAFLYAEMEDTPLDTIRAVSEREIQALRTSLEEIVARLGTSGDPHVVLRTYLSEYPVPAELIQTTAEILEEIRRYTQDRGLFESNQFPELQVVATPPFFRVQGSMALKTAGFLEQGDELSYFMLTPPGTDWRPAQVKAHLENFNTRSLRLALIREIHPGQYLHYSHLKQSGNRIRQLLASKASTNGWSHYVEQMLLDEGYGWDDPVLRLMQLQNALIEQCRLTTAIGLHSGEMSLGRAAQVFRDRAYLDTEVAMREARAVARDWTRASAALGKLQILKLREDYMGDEPSRSLRSFHDGLLSGAGLPLKLSRLMLMPEDQRPTLAY
jgi:uncharacterized protein (DUF885 family)